MTTIDLDLDSIDSYRLFLRIKSLPRYRFSGRTAIISDEYASLLGIKKATEKPAEYTPEPWMFDYQKAVSSLSVRKKKFAMFISPGWGKSNCFLSYARHALKCLGPNRNSLIVSPLMVVKQTIGEAKKFFGDSYPIEQIVAKDLQSWLRKGTNVGITNFEAIREDLDVGKLGCLIIDEAQMLKSHFGKWGTKLISMGKGLEWKLSSTGTPAPNDRIEYANQAVFLDAFPTVNSFLAKFFINRGQTGERWELKPHAIGSFYRALSDWSIFMNNPGTYGFTDNVKSIPDVEVNICDVELTDEQHNLACRLNGTLLATTEGGITKRATMGQIAKGNYKGKKVASNKPQFVRDLVDLWPDESTIIWCHFDREQDAMEMTFPEALSMRGATPHDKRESMIEDFKNGKNKVLISKARVLGLGLNLQVCTRMIFNGLKDSWEEFHQCIKRANRVGSTKRLRVYIPTTTIERPMLDTVLAKAHRIDEDDKQQELLFKKSGFDFFMEK